MHAAAFLPTIGVLLRKADTSHEIGPTRVGTYAVEHWQC